MDTEYQFKRKEFKYYVPWERQDALRERFLMHMEYDPFCVNRKDHMYSVRSIYFDTPGLLFYYEKIDGLKLRKKLRVRSYDKPGDHDVAFLEIKRKIKNIIMKERAGVPIGQAPNLLNGARLNLLREKPSIPEKAALSKFIFLVKRLNLNPTVLITYEREAFVGVDDENLRVTFDCNVRSYPNPDFDDLFREEDLREISPPWFVLEIKFYGVMPLWTRELVRDFGLRKQAISKYCNGLDMWLPNEEVAGPY
jgi:SPX domain protein involved in polyphosphate accumulation